MDQSNANMAQINSGSAQLTYISAKEFGSKFQSKRECYHFLALECDRYVPPYDNVTIYYVGGSPFVILCS